MSFDNITFRKNVTKKLNLSENFLECMECEQSSLTDSSTMSQSNILNPGQKQILLDLQQEIETLKNKLRIAHEHVQKLHSEKQELNEKIKNYEQKIFHVTKKEQGNFNNCTNDYIINSNKNCQTSTLVHTSHLDVDIQQNQTSTPIQKKFNRKKPATSKINEAVEHSIQTKEQQHNTNKILTSIKKTRMCEDTQKKGASSESPKYTLFILGDQQVKGLASRLIYSRKNKWNDDYSISALVKPNALSSEVLSYCDILRDELKLGDKVVISIGSNDKNPYILLQNLCLALYKLQKFKVYILQTETNKYLQEKMINDTISSLVKTFNNCEFIHSKSSNNMKTPYLIQLIRTLNIKIDSDDYEKQYLVQSKNKSLAQINNDVIKMYKNTHTKTSSNIIHNRGTIPYFFEKQRQKIKLNKNILHATSTQRNSNDIRNSPIKGTIPYYFQKIDPKDKNTEGRTNQFFL